MLGVLILAAVVLFLTRLCCIFDEEREMACDCRKKAGNQAAEGAAEVCNVYDISGLCRKNSKGQKGEKRAAQG